MPAPTTFSGLINGSESEEQAGKQTTYLVTGANRGIGRGLLVDLLLRPNSLIIACVRDPSNSTSLSLCELPKAEHTHLVILKLDCEAPEDPTNAINDLKKVHGVKSIDIVIANAAIAMNYGPMSTLSLEALERHMQRAHTRRPCFVLIGAPISTITEMEAVARAPLGAYGLSKLAACYLMRKFHFENKWLISFVVDPGHVQTDMGDQGARLLGRKEAPTTIDDSVRGILARVDGATKETSSGHFLLHEDGSKVPW